MDYRKLIVLALLASPLCAEGPLFKHKDGFVDREFGNAYNDIRYAKKSPTVMVGSGAPTSTPRRVGDIYISTTTSKVYFSTATVNSASWIVVN